MDLKKFFSELKRRNVYKVALTYAITSWLLAQIIALAADTFGAPDWVTKIVFVILAIGLPIALILAWAFEMSPQGIIRTSSVATHENPYSSSRKKPLTNNMFIGILVVIIVGQFAYNKYSNKELFVSGNLEKSIAVLPLRNDSSDKNNEYFGNGIMEDILDHLGKIGDLEVKSRTDVEQYRDQQISIKKIGAELEVNYIIEGSVRKEGDNLKITAHLIEVASGNRLWSKTYEDKYTDEIFKFMTDISKKTANSMNAVITPLEEKRLNKNPASNIDTYDLILKAKEEQRKYWESGYTDIIAFKKAELLFDMVMKLDSTNARNWKDKASMYMDKRGHIDYFNKSLYDSAIWYCDKALSFDANYAQAYFLKGLAYHARGEIDKAIENYKKVLDLNQNNKGVLGLTLSKLGSINKLGSIYMYKNEFTKAIPLLKEAVELENKLETKYGMLSSLGFAYVYIGEFKKAKKYYTERNDGWSKCVDLMMLDFYQGKFKETIETLDLCCDEIQCEYRRLLIYIQLKKYEKATDLYKEYEDQEAWVKWFRNKNLYRIGFALIKTGEKEKGRELIEEQLVMLEKMRKLDRPSGYDYDFAAIYAFQGNTVRALEHLQNYDQKVLTTGVFRHPILFAQYDVLFENIWENEEFKVLMNNVSVRNKEIASQLKD